MRVKGIGRDVFPYAVTDIYSEELGHQDLIRSSFNGLRIIADLEQIHGDDSQAIVADVERLLDRLREKFRT